MRVNVAEFASSDVALQLNLVDFDRDSRTDALIYKEVFIHIFIHITRRVLEKIICEAPRTNLDTKVPSYLGSIFVCYPLCRPKSQRIARWF